jgi:thioredoxin reductase
VWRARRRGGTALVVGAGLAGLSAADALAEEGFAVEVWEASDRIGGVLASLAELPHISYRDHMFAAEDLLASLRRKGIEVGFGRRWVDGQPEVEQFDAIALATGAARFALEGISAVDLRGYVRAPEELGEDVAVVSNGEGVQVAISIARSGRSVRLITIGPQHRLFPFVDDGAHLEESYDSMLSSAGVERLHGRLVVQLAPDRLRVVTDDEVRTLQVSTIVVAGRSRAWVEPARAVRRGQLVRLVGDAARPGNIAAATSAGWAFGAEAAAWFS